MLRILVVEDNSSDAELILRELDKAQIAYTAKCVWTRELFLKEAEEFDPQIILADYNLPQFNAIEALNLLKQRAIRTPLILVTGSLGEELAVRCIQQGAVDYVLKQNLTRLPTALLNAVQSRRMEEEREKAEAALRASEEYFRSLIEKSKDIIAVMNVDGSVRYVSPSCKQVLGYEPEELVGQPGKNMIHSDDIDRLKDGLDSLEQGRDQEILSVRVRYKNGSPAFLDVRLGNHLSNPAIGGIVVNAQDVTERVLAEKSEKAMEEQFRQVQKMETIGQMAGGIAHDFNNILMAVMGFGELLGMKMDPESPLQSDVKNIYETAKQGMDLTRQLLVFSRKQVLEPRALRVEEIIGPMEGMLRRLLGARIQLHLKMGVNLRLVRADRSQIQQVVMNLAVNARDAMPAGGKLLIECENAEITESYAANKVVVQPGKCVMIQVADTGTGMDEETQQHIFEPFFTTKDRDRGTGLGLSTVYGIVKQSGGHIEVFSRPGDGANFKIYLPVADELLLTLLLVDDNDALRNALSELLRRKDYVVIAASSAEEAFMRFKESESKINLLITDIDLPGDSGPALIGQLRVLDPSLRVLCLSGSPDAMEEVDQRSLSQVSFLQKPVSMSELLDRVRQILEST